MPPFVLRAITILFFPPNTFLVSLELRNKNDSNLVKITQVQKNVCFWLKINAIANSSSFLPGNLRSSSITSKLENSSYDKYLVQFSWKPCFDDLSTAMQKLRWTDKWLVSDHRNCSDPLYDSDRPQVPKTYLRCAKLLLALIRKGETIQGTDKMKVENIIFFNQFVLSNRKKYFAVSLKEIFVTVNS